MSEVDTTNTYRDGNALLFDRRKQLQTEVRELEADPASSESILERRRLRRLRRELDDVTAQIVNFNMGLVRSYCKRFSSNATRDTYADFEAAGVVGLMRAVESFDPEQGGFGQWAFKPIQREVLRAVRDADHPNVNLGDFERRPEILRAFRHLQGVDESYRPSEAEVAAAAGVTLAQVRRVLAPPRLDSLHRSVSADGETQLAELVESTDMSPEATIVSKFTLSALQRFGLAALDARELYVVVRRFGLDGEPEERLADIGETLDLSREAVRQIEAKALAKLQHPMVLRKIHSDGRAAAS